MADGGIHDQLGGGFAPLRDRRVWLVPHFEKMLYDNAQLARVYLHAWQLTGESALRATWRGDTLDFMARDLLARPDGVVRRPSLDADTEGVRGRYLRLDRG